MIKELNIKKVVIKEMGKIDNGIITELPRYKSGKVNYKAMVGLTLKILYKNNEYEVKIIKIYRRNNTSRFQLEYNGKVKDIVCQSFVLGNFGGILEQYTKNFKINIGTVFKDKKRDLVVIDRKYKNKTGKSRGKEHIINEKWYRYKCNKCGWDKGWIREANLLQQRIGCSCCNGMTVVEDINSIWITDRWMCSLGLSEEDAKTHTKCSGDKVIVTCPDCGKQKGIMVATLYKYGFRCSCGGGFSYPERFMMGVLNQLGVEYVFQLTKNTFEWCNNVGYDFYIPSINAIIETHGRQHYEETKNFKRTLKEEQRNDRVKYELALQNGIKEDNYIVIDCRHSDKEYIENNILNSKLNKLFDLSKVDWVECGKFALNNLIREICEYWNNKEEWETVTDIGKGFGLHRDTIRGYLKKGAELGLCNYDPKKEAEKNISRGMKRVSMYDLEGNYIMEGSTSNELAEKIEFELGFKISVSSIQKVCRGECSSRKGYIFKYI